MLKVYIVLFLKYRVSDQTNEVSAIGAIFILLILKKKIATARFEKTIQYKLLS